MLDELLALKDTLQRVDLERRPMFNAAMRQAVDLLGLRCLGRVLDLGPGLVRRYTSKSAPHPILGKIVVRHVIALIDERIAAQDFTPRSDEDREYEAELAKPFNIPFPGW